MYSQRDLRWSWQYVGTSNRTILRVGCLLTCFAQLLTNHGHGFTPAQLNKYFKLTRRYIQTNILNDNAIEIINPKIKHIGSVVYPKQPVNLSLLECEPGEEIILKVDYNNDPKDGEQRHFVLLKSWDGHDTVRIADPIGGCVGNFKDRYGDPRYNILKIIKYAFKE